MSMYDSGAPIVEELKAGDTVYICRCGKTGNAPWCDGSHAGTDITPLAHTPEKDGEVYICGCGKSGNIPWCDGSHNK